VERTLLSAAVDFDFAIDFDFAFAFAFLVHNRIVASGVWFNWFN
jgi:hypothetical protein